jgi:three-Cys-motif partner protein
MATERFFEESLEQSQVKARIVQKYFWAWAKVIMPHASGGRIAYLDLFAGPGRYQDGAASTPLLILQEAIKNPKMSQMLVTEFNDRDANNSQSLETAIKALHRGHRPKDTDRDAPAHRSARASPSATTASRRGRR